MKRDGATCIHSKAQGLCLSWLVDVNAQAIEARRDGATCTHSKAQGDCVCLGQLDVNAQAIRLNMMGQLAHIPRRSRAAGCERTGDRGEAGWGACMYFKKHKHFVARAPAIR